MGPLRWLALLFRWSKIHFRTCSIAIHTILSIFSAWLDFWWWGFGLWFIVSWTVECFLIFFCQWGNGYILWLFTCIFLWRRITFLLFYFLIFCISSPTPHRILFRRGWTYITRNLENLLSLPQLLGKLMIPRLLPWLCWDSSWSYRYNFLLLYIWRWFRCNRENHWQAHLDYWLVVIIFIDFYWHRWQELKDICVVSIIECCCLGAC